MNIQEIVTTLFEVAIIPILIILTRYFVTWISTKVEELKTKTDNELFQKYISLLGQTVIQCVTTTQQTYVDSLKQQGKFDAEAQKKAFEDTYKAVLELLPNEAWNYLDNICLDLKEYIKTMIESEVYFNKNR